MEIYDSVSYVTALDVGKVIITGSHGGSSSAKYALEIRPYCVVFNSAGGGKNQAGVSGLKFLDKHGIASVAVDANSAEIGSAKDTLESGVISHCNEAAKGLGASPGMAVKEMVELFIHR